MLFNSWQFAVFLPIVFALYWAIPKRHRWCLLLAASYYFYMSWNVRYVVLILFTTIVSYAAALLIERTQSRSRRRLIIAATLVSCIGLLFVFKYLGFFLDSVNSLFSLFAIQLHPITLKLMLPVGISFYTFQTLSYVIDVYRGDVHAQRHFGIYATFVSFFPQLVAGPIERTENLLPQITHQKNFDYDQATAGLRLMVWGFFKKIVVADSLAAHVDLIYDNPSDYSGFALVLATLFFTVQIYCDFSGYSDIARGTAKLMGIELMENFKHPYFSSSIKEFWSRWHISLSTWFRDYIYIPLGGNRRGKLRQYVNLLITFLVSGLWHGANWTFVVWGGLHGAAQAVEKALGIRSCAKKSGIVWVLRVAAVFLFSALAWVFFRAQSLSDAVYVLTNMFDGIASLPDYIRQGFVDVSMGKLELAVSCLFLLAPLTAYDYISYRSGTDASLLIAKRSKALQWSVYLILGFIIILFSPKGVAAEFVYFQF